MWLPLYLTPAQTAMPARPRRAETEFDLPDGTRSMAGPHATTAFLCGRHEGRLATRLRRAASWHRRLLVAGLLAASAAFAIDALSFAAPHESVLVAARTSLVARGCCRRRTDEGRLARRAPGRAVRSRTFAAGRTP
jgi:hypothetical protein